MEVSIPVIDTQIIDGRKLADELNQATAARAIRFTAQKTRPPGLAVIMVGENEASQIYVGMKQKIARDLGIECTIKQFPESVQQHEILSTIKSLNINNLIDGIIVQLPLPPQINPFIVQNAVSPAKDLDGLTVRNVGLRLTNPEQALLPCTPRGILKLLSTVHDDLTGMNAYVIGRSAIVGRPAADLLGLADCTVTLSHIKSRALPELVKTADIVIVATGHPKLVDRNWIKPGATIIDVGISRIDNPESGRKILVGDCDYSDLLGIAGAITPVPGGVGPMTVACLMENTIIAAERNCA